MTTSGTLEINANMDAWANALAILPPVSRGLVDLKFIHTDGPTSLANKAYGGAQGGSVVGTPTFGSGYGSFKGYTNFLQLPYVDPTTFTFLVAGRSTDNETGNADDPAFLSSILSSAQTGGAGLRVSGGGANTTATLAGAINYINAGARTQLGLQLTGIDFTAHHHLMALTYDETTRIGALYDLTTGASTTATAPAGSTREVDASQLRLGSSLVNILTGTVDIAMMDVRNVALTQAELQALYPYYAKVLLDKQGVTI